MSISKKNIKNNWINNVPDYNNLREVIKEPVEKHPNNIAFTLKKTVNNKKEYKDITYKEFYKDIQSFGTGLLDLGLKNKRVAVISKNNYEWITTYLAVVNGVGIIVPLDKGLPENEIETSLQRSSADAIVFSSEYIDIMKNIQANGNTNVRYFICMDDKKECKNTNDFQNVYYFNELIQKGNKILYSGNTEFEDYEIDNEKMSIILFTSGTTSASKAVMLSHKNIASNITALNRAEDIYDTDTNLAFLPFHHTFGCTGILLVLNNGARNVFCDGIRHIANNLKEYKVTMFVCVPLLLESMYKKIMTEVEKKGKTKSLKLGMKISNFLLKFNIDIRKKLFKEILDNLGGHMRFVVSGASAIDHKVAKGFNDLGILTIQGYGLTETSPVLIAENEHAIRYGSIGYPLSNVEIEIYNPNEKGIGEIIAKGPNVMLGYYENEEATNECIKDGWFHTGDLGYVDDDGYIFITGRQKNVIVLKNGKNVYPEELEILINNLPYVEESMVFGMPKDSDLTVSVKIVYNKDYIEDKYPNANTQEQIHDVIWKDIKEINKGLSNYKHMKKLIVSDEPMIKTSTAKVKRFEEIKKIMEEIS